MKIFILEDDLVRIGLFIKNLGQHELTIAEDLDYARKRWQPPYDIVLLDHDLGGQVYVSSDVENTGAGFVKDLLLGPLENLTGKFFVHSWNPDGGDLMHQLLINAGVDSTREYFGPKLFARLKSFIEGAKS